MQSVFNPFLPEGTYIPDGEPHVFGDRVYLFGSHDKEGGDSFCLLDYEVWSAPVNDLSSWSCPGTAYSAKRDPLYSEERPYLYAPDVVQGNDGRFYLYYCLAGWKGSGGYDGPVSVAVCDTPDGKYTYHGFVRNPDGSPFGSCVVFDPAVINDNGTIRLYTGTSFPLGMRFRWWNQLLLGGIAEGMYHRPKEEFTPKTNPLGAYTVELEDDMLTVRGQAKKILPEPIRKNGFAGHAFFEGSSIRRIGDTYYFIYSSQKNHELCYAISQYPDRDFRYGGTIVSTGDVGFRGRKDKDRLNVTGTTHGSIEKVNGQWYVFYHRLSDGCDYCRQACGEKIEIKQDGSIGQVEVTSSGLGGALPMGSPIPAVKACVITNGNMPHISNKRWDKPIPKPTFDDRDHFVTGIVNGVTVGFRYFDCVGDANLRISYRGRGSGKLMVSRSIGGDAMAELTIADAQEWTQTSCQVPFPDGKIALYLRCVGDAAVDLLQIELEKIK